MSLSCPKCGRQFDVTLFEYGRKVACECGEIVTLRSGQIVFLKPKIPPKNAKNGDKAADD